MDYEPQLLRHLFNYMIWADRIMLDAAGKVPEAEYHKERGFSAGSIHQLLVHQLAAQGAWLSRWHGTPPTRLEDENDYPVRDVLRQRWPALHAELLDFLSRQSRDSLNTKMHTRRTNGEPIYLPLGGMMLHVVDHAGYHRGQLNSMLKLSGAQTAYPSYIRFLNEHPS